MLVFLVNNGHLQLTACNATVKTHMDDECWFFKQILWANFSLFVSWEVYGCCFFSKISLKFKTLYSKHFLKNVNIPYDFRESGEPDHLLKTQFVGSLGVVQNHLLELVDLVQNPQELH